MVRCWIWRSLEERVVAAAADPRPSWGGGAATRGGRAFCVHCRRERSACPDACSHRPVLSRPATHHMPLCISLLHCCNKCSIRLDSSGRKASWPQAARKTCAEISQARWATSTCCVFWCSFPVRGWFYKERFTVLISNLWSDSLSALSWYS